jgi:riboflavin kinase/FMN adenylyltransferase
LTIRVINGLDRIRLEHRGAVVTIGNFDGMHLGHQKIIESVSTLARPHRSKTLAITFSPHPMKVLVPERGVKTLTSAEEKARLMGHYGLDSVLVVNFTRQFAKNPADAFIEEVLVRKLGAKAVVVGHSYAFGKGKQGTTALLRKRGEKYGFKVRVVRNATLSGDVVSSSRIRSLISWGRVCDAASYLGRPYAINGTVIKGAGRGARMLDTPTANIATECEAMPRGGVYAVRVKIDGRYLYGAANIGTNPTFKGSAMSYEVHIFDFEKDVLGKKIKVFFIERIREERAFPGIDALHTQILQDIAAAREILTEKESRPPFDLLV